MEGGWRRRAAETGLMTSVTAAPLCAGSGWSVDSETVSCPAPQINRSCAWPSGQQDCLLSCSSDQQELCMAKWTARLSLVLLLRSTGAVHGQVDSKTVSCPAPQINRSCAWPSGQQDCLLSCSSDQQELSMAKWKTSVSGMEDPRVATRSIHTSDFIGNFVAALPDAWSSLL